MIFRIATYITLIAAASMCAHSAHASYRANLNRVTHGESLYDLYTGNAKILLKTTLFTDRFREAFALKHAKVHYMNEQDQQAWLAEQQRAQGQGWDVFVSMFTPKVYRKFSLKPDTFWTAYLTSDAGESVYPVEIIKLDRTPYWQVMFPYVSHWAKIYLVRFPKIEFGSSASFTIHSVVGRTTITWRLADEDVGVATD